MNAYRVVSFARAKLRKMLQVSDKSSQYEVFAKKGTIKDPALGIELPVEAIFR
jgi:hypothetical protein